MIPNHYTGETTRRKILKSGSMLAAGGLLAGCTGNGGSSDNDEEGENSNTNTATPTSTPKPSYHSLIGKGQTTFADTPYITATKTMMPANTDDRMTGEFKISQAPDLRMKTLLSGDLSAVNTNPIVPMQAQVSGNESIRIIAPRITGTDYVLVVNNDIERLDEFVGSDLKMAMSSPSGIEHLQIRGIAEKKSLNADEMNFVSIGGSSSRTKAVASGKVAGAAIHKGQFLKLQDQGIDVKVLVDFSEHFPNFVEEGIITTQKMIETRPEWIQAHMDATLEANKKASEDFEWVFQETKKHLNEPPSRENAKSEWDTYVNVVGTWPTKKFSKDVFNDMLVMVDSAGLIEKKEVDIDSLVETKFWDEAVK